MLNFYYNFTKNKRLPGDLRTQIAGVKIKFFCPTFLLRKVGEV